MARRAGGCYPRGDGAHQPGADPAREGTGRALRNPATADGQPRGRTGGKSELSSGEDGIQVMRKSRKIWRGQSPNLKYMWKSVEFWLDRAIMQRCVAQFLWRSNLMDRGKLIVEHGK